MKVRAWTETKPIRAIPTGDGFVEVREGDFVVVAVVKRWEDVRAVLAEAARLHEGEK